MFAINIRGPFFLMQEAIRRMIRDGIEGAIVNIGSISALAGQPFISAYCASKGALATLTRNTAFAVMRQPHPGEPAQHRLDGLRPRAACRRRNPAIPIGKPRRRRGYPSVA